MKKRLLDLTCALALLTGCKAAPVEETAPPANRGGTPLTQEEIDAYRPWVLAGTLTQLGISDESTGDAAWAVDLYVQSKALNNSVTVDGVESAVYQAEIFNSLSDPYQEEYLASGLATYEAGAAGEPEEPGEAQEPQPDDEEEE